MTARHRSGKFKARPLVEAAPLLAPDAGELTRAAKLLAQHRIAVQRTKRAAYVKAHCAAILRSMGA